MSKGPSGAASPADPGDRLDVFRRLVLEIATRLSSASFEETDHAIQEALAGLGRLAGVDRSYVFLVREDDPSLCDNTHEWCADGISPQIDNLHGIPMAMYGELFDVLERGEAWCCPDVSALPPEQAATRETLEAQDIRSLVLVPMMVQETLLGFIGFDWVRRPEPAVARLEPLLRITSGIIAQAVQRYRQHRLLLDHRRRLQELVQAQHRDERTIRRRLATALHDGVGQHLAALKLELQLDGRRAVTSHPEHCRRLIGLVDSCLAAIRELSFEIYPASLRRDGLLAALRELAAHLAESPDFRLHLDLPAAEPPLSEDLRAELYLAARELVHNARKASGAPAAHLTLSTTGNSLRLTVSDRGRGFDPTAVDQEAGFQHGFGLADIRERFRERGGELIIDAAPGRGAAVTIVCPLKPGGPV